MISFYSSMVRTVIFIFVICAILACTDRPTKAKNVIFLIGDGMGVSHLTAYRLYKHTLNGGSHDNDGIKPTVFDQHLVGLSSTNPDDNTWVTDSAASATALSAGVKTYNGAIGLDNDKSEVETMFEFAKKMGKQTASISTSQVTHATPASFMAHEDTRRNQNEIADDILTKRVNGQFVVDLMLGGGIRYFVREDKNLVAEFQQHGFQYSDKFAELDTLSQLPALGLFADKGFPYAIDAPELGNRLQTMTKKGLQLLEQNNDNGFVLMIEGSLIDWCSHGKDAACSMLEMQDFEQTLDTVIKFAEQDGETLVVVTADHGTGGLTLGANDKYLWLPEVLLQVRQSADSLASQMITYGNVADIWNAYIDFALTEEQLNELQILVAKKDFKAVMAKIVSIINETSYTGWTTGGHVADDVAVMAFGPGSERFRGMQDNTDIAKKIFEVIGK